MCDPEYLNKFPLMNNNQLIPGIRTNPKQLCQ